MIKKNIFLLILASSMLACVPTKQFKEVNQKSNQLETERDVLMADNERLTVDNTEMHSKMDQVKRQIDEFVEDSIRNYELKEKLNNEIASLRRKYDDLQSSHSALLQGNAQETRRLLGQLQTTQGDLQKKEDRLRELETNMNERRQDLNRLSAELEARNAKLAELQKILDRKDSAVNALKESVSRALTGFEGQGLTVETRNGKVYVSMDEKLLFRSGSYDVDSQGRKALKELARVLEKNKDVNIMIEGHTDDVPYRSATTIKDNWDLSVLRATSVLKILLEDGNIAPSRLTASGRGETQPIDPAKTATSRAKNRRTEIILTPKLDELLKILETN